MGDEEGAIKIIDVDLSSTSQAENSGVWWRAHNNGVFDIKWCDNDTRLLSASADQTLRIHDVSQDSSKLLAVLGGHTSTIKSTVFLDPSRSGNSSDFSNSNIIASGGRDGNINIYDLRCHGAFSQLNDPSTSLDTTVRRSARARNARDAASNQVINPVMTLRQPHNVPTGRRSTTETRSVSRTITSLVALQSMPGILASGGSFDGIVKLWDIRCPDPSSGSRPKATPYGVLPDPTILGNPSRRSRSVNALCESPITGDLYALCGDSQIHVLRPSAAKADSDPLEAILPKKFVHPDLLTRSFYIRMSLSADGKYLACGSSHAGVMVWDTGSGNTTVTGSRLPFPKQHSSSQEPEAIAVDWGRDILAASSDDCTTRLWRSNSEIAAALTSTHRGTESGWSGIV
ncbi:multisubstrate pseudouridine synthase 7 [Vanrija albida]|uniref:Multisubstrate pseudouridine synthase 7 n=1 Tax=Vanrija albida TaxID=181172 RepID=A0ABR3Q2N8_9TREE